MTMTLSRRRLRCSVTSSVATHARGKPTGTARRTRSAPNPHTPSAARTPHRALRTRAPLLTVRRVHRGRCRCVCTVAGVAACAFQDCAAFGHPLGGDPGHACACVFDGHGALGHVIATEAMHTLYGLLEGEAFARLAADPALALADAFDATNEHLKVTPSLPAAWDVAT